MSVLPFTVGDITKTYEYVAFNSLPPFPIFLEIYSGYSRNISKLETKLFSRIHNSGPHIWKTIHFKVVVIQKLDPKSIRNRANSALEKITFFWRRVSFLQILVLLILRTFSVQRLTSVGQNLVYFIGETMSVKISQNLAKFIKCSVV